MREEEDGDDGKTTTTTFRPRLYFGHMFEKGTYYLPTRGLGLKRKEKVDLEEDDVDDDDSEGGIPPRYLPIARHRVAD